MKHFRALDFIDAATAATTLTLDTFGEVHPSPAGRFTWVAQQYGRSIVQGIDRVTGGRLSDDDLRDAYQEAMCKSWGWLRDRDLPAKEYLPVMRAIAYCKGRDDLRRLRHRPLTNVGEALYTIADPRHCRGRQSWWQRLGQAEREEFSAALVEIVAELPVRQRLMALVFLEHYEEFGQRATFRQLTRLVRDVTKRPEKVATIRSTWRTARRTIEAKLRDRGYDLVE
jgi:DNA-directed RNA polymerase specialized sigma24 family protein